VEVAVAAVAVVVDVGHPVVEGEHPVVEVVSEDAAAVVDEVWAAGAALVDVADEEAAGAVALVDVVVSSTRVINAKRPTRMGRIPKPSFCYINTSTLSLHVE
jgi:hypothetical protein